MKRKMTEADQHPNDQHFCLRWNNFHANITTQFEALRYDKEFTDVTIACEGLSLQGHKVVLSACSPYFKELFKANPCSHPIVFMRDVEARHIIALMEFMYVGEVNVAQAHLSTFLKTAESLKIRGLTDTSSESDPLPQEDSVYLKPHASKSLRNGLIFNNKPKSQHVITTSSQDVPLDVGNSAMPSLSSPGLKVQCKSETDMLALRKEDSKTLNPFALQHEMANLMPKIELPEYVSDEDNEQNDSSIYYTGNTNVLPGGINLSPQLLEDLKESDSGHDSASQTFKLRRRKLSDQWSPYSLYQQFGRFDNRTKLFEQREYEKKSRLIKLGEGIEIYEDQLHGIKWNDYRKLTRGLATILFSPAELATCSVTGQRWSRAGNGERPVKPALDRAKVQAIISYVASRFPMIEISRIKQVLAYKCKENSTAFKMKAVRHYVHGESAIKTSPIPPNVE